MWLSREKYNVKFLRTRQHSHSRANKRSRSTTGAGRSGDEALESLDVEDVWRKCRRVLSTVTSHALETPNEDMQYQSELSAAPVTGFSTSPDSSTLLASSPTFPDVSDPAGSLSFLPLSTGRPRSPSSPAAQRQSGDLRAVWLQNERARSGMQYAWKEEEAWARQMEGATMNQEEAVRLLRFYGAEFKDE
ncbi:hypothetical protein BUE80_DR009304 [Diplocarpon rosae]|nr:hypothetical protein BUE80_DR009304 [Diplocarpon rosae]